MKSRHLLASLALGLALVGCGSSPVSQGAPAQTVDFPVPAGWTRSVHALVSPGTYADVLVSGPVQQGFEPYAAVLSDTASGNTPSTAALAEIAYLQENAPGFLLDSSLSRPVQGNMGYLIQYRYGLTDPVVVVREQLFLYRQRDWQVVTGRLASDTVSARLLADLETRLILD